MHASSKKALRRILLAGISVVALTATYSFAQAPIPSASVFKIVTYTVPPDALPDFLEACQDNAKATRQETGTISFQVLRPQGQPNTVILLEEYKSQAASDSHSHTAHFLAFMQSVAHSGANRNAVVASPLEVSK